MESLAIVALLLVFHVVGTPIYLLMRQRRLERDLAETRRRLDAADDALARLGQAPGVPAATGPATGLPADTPAPEPEPEEMPEEEPGQPPSESAPPEAAEDPADTGASDIPAVGRAPGPARSMEETLTSQWLIWVGTLAVGLSAVFLFGYAIEQGWLTPMARVILGLILGGALLSAGEWARRNPVAAVRRAVNPDYVAPALTGTGIFAVFVSLFAAHALYGLLSPATGFVALGLTAYAALGLSLRQGPFVALVGLVAGCLVPALVHTPEPQALPLFLYLFVLTAGCLVLMVWRKWWWFSFLTLAGALVWPVLWLVSDWSITDQGVLGAYALGLSILFAVLSTSLPIKRPDAPFPAWMAGVLSDTSGLGFLLSGVLLLALADAAGFNAAAFALVAAYGAAALLLATRRAPLEGLVIAAAAIALALLLIWPEPPTVTDPGAMQDFPRPGFGPFAVPPEFKVFATATWVFAGLFGLGGFAGLFRGRTPVVWAGVSALMPLLFFTIGYWRMGALETDVSWAAVAVGLAILAAVAANLSGRARARLGDLPLAFYAAASTAAIALAFTCLLREAWLTVALSVETLALAWIWSRVRVDELRAIAGAVTLVVIVRLVANPYLTGYDGAFLGLFSWVIYGYGIPAVTTYLAARIFAQARVDAVTTLCEIASAGFAFLMVALQLKLWSSGAMVSAEWRLFDQAVQSLWWIVAAGLLLHEAGRSRRDWAYPAGLGLLALSIAAVAFAHLFQFSPLITNEPVGRLPILNLLGLAYLVPAGLFYVLAQGERLQLPETFRHVLRAVCGCLVFVYITLETRHAFWGTGIGLSSTTQPSNAEFYAYSAVWIVFALVLLALGILRGSVPLRYASLAVLMLTVAKVFLFDMSDLIGLFRVASFLGLGLTLIGIGRIYQRFVFRPAGSDGSPEDDG